MISQAEKKACNDLNCILVYTKQIFGNFITLAAVISALQSLFPRKCY
jgi:hypothetical protein